MSADLFAEFNEPAKNPTAVTSQSSFGQPSIQAPTQASVSGKDPFDFLGNSRSLSASVPQPAQQWPSSSAQHVSVGSWSRGDSNQAPPVAAAATVADEDEWGDFETSQPQHIYPSTQPQQSLPWAPPQEPIRWEPPAEVLISEQPPESGMVRASAMDLMKNSLVATEDKIKPAPAPSIRQDWPSSHTKPKLKHAPSDPNVLFNAEDFELDGGGDDHDDDYDDDDFGDFETVQPAIPQTTQQSKPVVKPDPPSLDLLGLSLDDSASMAPSVPPEPLALRPPPHPGMLSFGALAGDYPTAPKSPSYQQRNPFPELAVKTPITTEFDKKDALKSASPVTAWPSFEPDEPKPLGKYKDDDDDWGAWDDMPSGVDRPVVNESSTKPAENWDWDSVDNAQPTSAEAADNEPPPINVPPPSVILSIFPDLLSSANQLFKPMGGQSGSIKDRILSDNKTVEFLKGYIFLATTAAHVIAGRKHRWHRDKILAKSMSISAAGSKGMKLAGVDKTQSTREDREAADVVAVWRDNVGRLRSAVAAAKTTGKANLRVPELSEAMQIQTAKLVPTAPKPCVICGLKREERVVKVDHEVEDSFGEWWVEHWGHRLCKNFWLKHEQKLRQR